MGTGASWGVISQRSQTRRALTRPSQPLREAVCKLTPCCLSRGDYMELDEKGFVRIFKGRLGILEPLGTPPPRLVNAIHLDKGQSVREISESAK
jgi:hypothetical protein